VSDVIVAHIFWHNSLRLFSTSIGADRESSPVVY
jgi:hypothetical protein